MFASLGDYQEYYEKDRIPILHTESTSWLSPLLHQLENVVRRGVRENYSDSVENPKKHEVTLIIPTIGRDTLSRTLESLVKQTSPDWRAIVLFDGIPATLVSPDPRITILSIEKKGQDRNHAGEVRNVGLRQAETDWVGFVDDDDSLAPTYVECLMNHINESSPDAVLFRMHRFDGRIMPGPEATDFKLSEMGISFAYKTEYVQRIYVPGKWMGGFQFIG